MTTNKTIQTEADVSAFLASVADTAQRADAEALVTLLKRASGFPAKMWGASIIGFGHYHYRYESGREGEMCRIGFSPRKGKTVIYIKTDFPKSAALLAKLGKYKTSGGCLYIKHLSDVDKPALEALCKTSLAHMLEMYPLGA
jgi:Domain of unknown function (DU1801)